MGRLSFLSPFLLPFFLFSLLQSPTFAVKKSYIVYLGEHDHGRDATSADLDRATNSHYNLLASLVGSHEAAKEKIFYSYTRTINGFAATLDEEEAAEIRKHPDVVSVFPNQGRKLHTTRSWDFLRLEKDGTIHPSSLWKKARFGADTIIGNLDTGVWPESKSFSDEGFGPIPSRWRGTCQPGHGQAVHCNRKLIGARYFNKGYKAALGQELNATFMTSRDQDGHGSHTLSTAGGNFVAGASVFGIANGTAKGGSPKARVAAYKVCWPPVNGSECFDADILAGFEAAISDGVDVLSVSLGGSIPSEFFEDGISIGAFHAVKKGITVVASAGNDGPVPSSASNLAPWLFTIGASTLDRGFISYAELGNNLKFQGASLSPKALPSKTPYPLISAAAARASNTSAADALLCQPGTLDPKKAKGKILVCLRGINPRIDKGVQARQAGAVGMILANDEKSANEVLADPHVLPATHINYTDGVAVFKYISSTKNPTGYITPVETVLNTKPAPVMATFSSRGPNALEPAILKPDLTAPGVNIIAAYTEYVGPSEENSDKRRTPFNTESGTSMSCPHVAGVVGLLKTLYPHWSPAAIKSAIMTTARIRDDTSKPMTDSSDGKRATPFDYGAGHLRPNRARDPGLVYDLTADDYLNYLCARGYNQSMIKLFSNKPHACPKKFSLADFNYPTITIPDLSGSKSVSRKVRNVGAPGTYKARVRSPLGVRVTVQPSTLKFDKVGEEKKFQVTFTSKGSGIHRGAKGADSDYLFGLLIWSDGHHYVRSPLVVKHQ